MSKVTEALLRVEFRGFLQRHKNDLHIESDEEMEKQLDFIITVFNLMKQDNSKKRK